MAGRLLSLVRLRTRALIPRRLMLWRRPGPLMLMLTLLRLRGPRALMLWRRPGPLMRLRRPGPLMLRWPRALMRLMRARSVLRVLDVRRRS